ncbi:DNA polymerase III subunit alpha [Olivibacter sp. SDN3]|uniref:DNA polymerase III subunit alpha n=1 Tax=Olivibacter sp. SDN3 TaxID=2764720 RepID=UPI001651ABFD|nr:DNA polymerase III subunit alpha [Olivibacter sp. SDN3]QNL49775.1 DNA polymerase III subunit alpha [Olivibacter sp. SDN3]
MFLNVHSHFSLRYGTMALETIVETAIKLGITEMVLTDINNSSGCMKFIRLCRKAGIRPIIGMEFRKNGQLLYIAIAKNKEGMREINEFLTDHNLDKTELPDRAPHFTNAYTIYPLSNAPIKLLENERIGIRYTELKKMFRKDLSAIKDRLVALHPVTFGSTLEYRLHSYLRAIDLKTVLSKVEEKDKCHQDEYFISPMDVEKMFGDHPHIIGNTKDLLADCNTDAYHFGKLNRKTFTGSKKDDMALLNKLTCDGMLYRYGPNNKKAQMKIGNELKVVDDLDFSAYFLITYDIIRYSMGKGYYHVGRGSGANSAVAYSLRITDVDPIRLDLYFERFLNPKRSAPPDFDIDYSWDEREDVQDYIFKRYGKSHTALLGTMSTFGDRSVIREIGKVLGLPKAEIDSFTDPTRDAQNKDNPEFKKIMAIHAYMQDMPNQRSIHAGGVLISEEPITYYTALDLPPKGMPTAQWDMYEAEAIGLDKFDILSQRGIGHIKEAANLILFNKKEKVDVHNVQSFLIDDQVNRRLKSGNTIGCFYIESPAMRQLLKKLQCGDYLTLVAASSIIRPGVASSGMMKNYIYYFHHPDEVKYLHPVMEEQLKETYGVMVYQEDVIKVCHHYAGLDMADADVLRRAMSGKYRSKAEFDKLVEKFFQKANEIGRDEETTKEVWRQVSSFAGYSFSKAHSASFAVESYQSLYLKTYYPMEFMVAVLNNYGGFYQRWLYVYELQKTGANVHLPCVNNSMEKVSIKGTDVYLGLIGIQGLDGCYVQRIPEERIRNGAYKNLEDFIKRTGITLEHCITLIRLGALRFIGMTKKALLWNVHQYLGQKTKPSNCSELFSTPAKAYKMPDLPDCPLESSYQELELLGYPLTLSMFDLLKTNYRGDLMAADLGRYEGKVVKMVGNYVCEKTVHTKNNKKMWFGTFLDVEGNFFDTTHFPNNTPVYPFRGTGCYLIEGKVVMDFDFPSIEVTRFAKLPIKDNPVMG